MELYQALLIALVASFGKFTGDIGGFMFDRPIVLAPLVGIILGDPAQGLAMGAALELIFLGVVSIGGATPSDANMGSVLGAAFAISLNQGVEIALALAVPIGLLLQMVKMIVYFFRSTTMHKVEEYAENGEFDKITRLHFGHCAIYVTLYAVIAFTACYFGADVIRSVVESIPEVVLTGLNNASQMLPAVGFALLMNMLWDTKLSVFLLFGFVLASYLGLPIIAVAIIALTVGVVMIVQDMNNRSKVTGTGTAVAVALSEEEDFFNE